MTRDRIEQLIREKAAFFGCADSFDAEKTAQLCDSLCVGDRLSQQKLGVELHQAAAFAKAFDYRSYWTDYLANKEHLTAFAVMHTLSGAASPYGALYIQHVESPLTAQNAAREAAKGEWRQCIGIGSRCNSVEMPLTDISAAQFNLQGFGVGACLFQKIMKHVARKLYDRYEYPEIIAGCGFWDEKRGVRCEIRSDLFRADDGMYLLFRMVCHTDGREERRFQVWFARKGRHFHRFYGRLPRLKKPQPWHKAVRPDGCEAQSMAECSFDPIAKDNRIPDVWEERLREQRGHYADLKVFTPDKFLHGGAFYQKMWMDTAAASPRPVDFRAKDFFIISHYIDYEDEERETDYELSTSVIAFSDPKGVWVFFRFCREHPKDGTHYVCRLLRARRK